MKTGKKPITWHEECLKNWMETNARNTEHLEQELARVKQSILEAEFYRKQIEEAKKKGMDGFERESFMKKKRVNL